MLHNLDRTNMATSCLGLATTVVNGGCLCGSQVAVNVALQHWQYRWQVCDGDIATYTSSRKRWPVRGETSDKGTHQHIAYQ